MYNGSRYHYESEAGPLYLSTRIWKPMMTVPDFQFYMIDGFIVSDNLEVSSVETMDLGFANSDHNPVLLRVRLPEK